MSTLRISTSQKGLSAVIDEYFEKFDKPDKKHVIDEYVCGKWASEKGESSIFRTVTRTASPSRNLWMTRDTCTVGWTGTVTVGKRGWLSTTLELTLLSDYVGDIHVRVLSETAIETQIKFSDDDEWQPPVVLTLLHRDASSERDL